MTTSTPGLSIEEMTKQMYADLYTNTPSIKSSLVKLEHDITWIKRLIVGLGVPAVAAVVVSAAIVFGV